MENIPYGEINKWSFSNPNPSAGPLWRCYRVQVVVHYMYHNLCVIYVPRCLYSGQYPLNMQSRASIELESAPYKHHRVNYGPVLAYFGMLTGDLGMFV